MEKPNNPIADGREVANFVLDFCESRGRNITNLSLQKIVYFCHAWCLTKLERPLIRHSFEAWQYGPVLQYLYREFKEYDASPIRSRAKKLNAQTGKFEIVHYKFDETTAKLLEKVVDFYSQLSASQLVDLSHTTGGPWDIVWNHPGRSNPGMKIDNETIATFYSKIQQPYIAQ
jgi:uncharacterized phage-associated protein